MKVGYKTSMRILIWTMTIPYILILIMMLVEDEFSLQELLHVSIIMGILWPYLVNRYFTVDCDTLRIAYSLKELSYDLRGSGSLVLEGNKVYVVVNNRKKRVPVYSGLADRKDWETFKSWAEENQPAGQKTFPLQIGPMGNVWRWLQSTGRRYAKPILAGLTVGMLALAVFLGWSYWTSRSAIQRILARAETARTDEDWHGARDAAAELLHVVPDHERAMELYNLARYSLRPTVFIRATRNGEDVSARIRIEGVGQGGTRELPTTHAFYLHDRLYNLFASYEEDGRWYQAPTKEIVTDWEGVQEMEMALELYTGSSPVHGADWRSPTTGMEFVWVEDLQIWVGKYEVTNGEYRKMQPAHDSGEYEGRSLNGDRQPVVQVNFRDAVAFARWMNHRDYEADELPKGYRYRLPSDEEFQLLMRVGERQRRPWGSQWPPPNALALNYSGEESLLDDKISGYRDAFVVSAPVDDLWVNPWGLAGVGGNVWQITSTRGQDEEFRYWRGEAWTTGHNSPYTSRDGKLRPLSQFGPGHLQKKFDGGFRLVLSP